MAESQASCFSTQPLITGYDDSKELYHICPVEHLPSILEHGLMAPNKILDLSFRLHLNDSYTEVLNLGKGKSPMNRSSVQDSLYDYVTLYLHAFNRTLCAYYTENKNICVLRIHSKVLRKKGCKIAEQNASLGDVKFHDSFDFSFNAASSHILHCNQSRINNPDKYEKYGIEVDDLLARQIREAEVLVPSRISSRYIKGVYVPDETVKKAVLKVFHIPFKITVHPTLFFGGVETIHNCNPELEEVDAPELSDPSDFSDSEEPDNINLQPIHFANSEETSSCYGCPQNLSTISPDRLSCPAPQSPLLSFYSGYEDPKELHYICPIKHLASILEHGLLARNKMHELGFELLVDVSSSETQDRRKGISPSQISPCKNNLHDYVNLYIHAYNRTLYSFNLEDKNLCVLRVHPQILKKKGCKIADRNASTSDVQFYDPGMFSFDEASSHILHYNRSLINSLDLYERYGIEIDDILARQVRQAEVLVPSRISSKYVKGIYVPNETVKEAVLEIFNFPNKVTTHQTLFFGAGKTIDRPHHELEEIDAPGLSDVSDMSDGEEPDSLDAQPSNEQNPTRLHEPIRFCFAESVLKNQEPIEFSHGKTSLTDSLDSSRFGLADNLFTDPKELKWYLAHQKNLIT